jgi:phosphohistidine phosphatase
VQTDTTGRRLVVMRHAKAEQTGSSDLGRTLTDRGRKDAHDAGRWLAGAGFVPDHALVSTADRTQETWSVVAGAAGWSLEPELDTALYSAGPESALDLLRLAPAAARSLFVVGHNPTMAFLAQMLDDGAGDAEVAAAMAAGFPTSAVTVFAYDGEWAGLDMGTATAVGFHVGRG